jgi:hypothetical protein
MSIRWLRCALLLGLLFVTPAPAAAISVVEPLAFGSWRHEPEVGSIGGGAAIGIASFDVVPTLEYVFVDHSRDWAITVDGHLPVLPLPLVAFYIGAGFTSYNHDPDQGEASWDSGLNVLERRRASCGSSPLPRSSTRRRARMGWCTRWGRASTCSIDCPRRREASHSVIRQTDSTCVEHADRSM